MIERMRIMSQKIKLSAPEDVKEFVKAANKCDFDIDISYNRVLVDAKSILERARNLIRRFRNLQ